MIPEKIVPVTPEVKLVKLLEPKAIEFYRGTKVSSTNDQLIGKKMDDVVGLDPHIYLNEYRGWLNTLVKNLSQTDNIAVRIFKKEDDEQSLIDSAAAVSIKIDNDFKTGFKYPISVKQVIARVSGELKDKYPHVDPTLIMTPAHPNADIWMEYLRQSAALGNQASFDRLANSVYFSDEHTQQVINDYVTTRNVDEQRVLELYGVMEDQAHHKSYAMRERADIALLDQILKYDNFDEILLWKSGLSTLPMWFMYHWVQKKLIENGDIENRLANSNTIFIDDMLKYFKGAK